MSSKVFDVYKGKRILLYGGKERTKEETLKRLFQSTSDDWSKDFVQLTTTIRSLKKWEEKMEKLKFLTLSQFLKIFRLFQKELSYEKEIPIIPANKSLGYRNKINVKVRKGKLGYYKEESHDFIPIRTCFIASPVIQNLLKDFSLFSFQDGELIIRFDDEEK